MFLNLSSVGGMVVGLAFVRSWKEQCLLCSNDDYEVVGSRGMLALRCIMLKDDTERDNTKRRGRIEEQRHGKMKMQSMYRSTISFRLKAKLILKRSAKSQLSSACSNLGPHSMKTRSSLAKRLSLM